MEKNLKNELLDAIKNKRLERKDMGKYPGAHSEPFFYKTLNGEDLVLLRAKCKDALTGYRKQQILVPFLQEQNLGVHTPRKVELLECGDETYAVMEGFLEKTTAQQNLRQPQKSNKQGLLVKLQISSLGFIQYRQKLCQKSLTIRHILNLIKRQ